MVSTFMKVYAAISLVVLIADLGIASKAFADKKGNGIYIGVVSLLAAAVDLTYMGSIYIEDYFLASICASAYFISIVWLLVVLVTAIARMAGFEERSLYRIIHVILSVWGLIDSTILAVNPFKEIVISYLYIDSRFAHYEYQMHLPYYIHLAFTYIMVLIIIGILAYCSIKSPKRYRKQFSLILAAVVIIVAVNGVFLYIGNGQFWTLIDYSIVGYSFALYILYYCNFKFIRNTMLRNISMEIFNKIDQGIVFFDYRGKLVMFNQKAKQLLSMVEFDVGLELEDFIDRCSLNVNQEEESWSLQCNLHQGSDVLVRRCDYRILKDEKGMTDGNLFVFTDMAEETDLITGFQRFKNFTRLVEENPDMYNRATTVAVFDINSLSTINITYGKDEGDRRIEALSVAMRDNLPEDTYYIRGNEAILIALSNTLDESQMNDRIDRIYGEFEGTLQSAIGVTDSNNPDVMRTIEEAITAMLNKKLMDKDSTSSQVITSLVKALQASDADTEAHVVRTQYYGNELGKRIGLSDVQQTQLSLLCLLHDIGKIGIPLEILNKPGKLTDEEWKVLKTHVDKGYEIAKTSEGLVDIAPMIRYHHERWDGKGYPEGISRETIPLLSRVIAVVDAFDAMTNTRPYRKASSINAAIDELIRCAGSQFDPTLVSEFVRMVRNNEIDVYGGEAEDDIIEVVTESSENLTRLSTVHAVHEIQFSRYILDNNNNIIEIDENFEHLTGYTQEDVDKGINQNDLIPEEDRTEYLITVNKQLGRTQVAYLEHSLQKKNGDIITVLCQGKQYFDSAAKAERSEIYVTDVLGTYSMMKFSEEQNQKAEKRLEHWENRYRIDSLTELLSHAPFRNDVEMYLIKGEYKIMLLMIDVDYFKQYNDTYGHSAGDEYLIFVSQTLKSALREKDLACRMGGDEFAAALFFEKDAPAELMKKRAGQIFAKLSMALKAKEHGTSISMGVAISDEISNNFKALYADADKALYASKEQGRDRMTIWEDIEE